MARSCERQYDCLLNVCPSVCVAVPLCMCGAVSNQIHMQIIAMIIFYNLFVSTFIHNAS